MKIAFRKQQLQALRTRAAARYQDWLEPVGHVGNLQAVMMPAIGWQMLHSDLLILAMGPEEGWLRSVPRALIKAITTITSELNRMEHHPALIGASAVGTHMEVLPVWRLGDGWSIYPQPHTPMVYLVPEFFSHHGFRATTWWPTHKRPSPARIFEEEAHLAFCREVQPVEVQSDTPAGPQ